MFSLRKVLKNIISFKELKNTNMTSIKVTSTIPEGCSKRLIGTHDGSFHCDESLACAMLHMTEMFKDAIIVRSRKPDILKECNVVVDVGATYDPSKLLFDHHQPEFNDTMSTAHATYKTRLSSAGLTYRHYGKEIIANLYPQLSAADLEEVYDLVYKKFIEHVDGNDNGVDQVSGERIVRNYQVTTALPARVADLSPRWNDDNTPDAFNQRFIKAVEITGQAFLEKLDFFASAWLPARNLVKEAASHLKEIHPSGKIIVFKKFCPWQEHLFGVEHELGIPGQIIYALFPDSNRGWRIRAVGVETGSSFENRKPIPWKGLRDDDLTKASGIPGGIFVHAAGFIGGNETYEGALKMAITALDM